MHFVPDGTGVCGLLPLPAEILIGCREKKETNMKKHRFIIVGSGWRSLCYVRIAKALPDVFELGAMLCRTEEKAERMARENDIYTTTSIEECKAMKPDFVVVVVNKTSIADVSKEWMGYGFTVLCETPAALDTSTLNELWEIHNSGGKLVVAEQYIYDPMYDTQLKILKKGLIGEPSFLHISLAHEYHGASLMRAYLQMDAATPFTVSAKTYQFPTVETMSRYEKFTDGRITDKKRTVGTFEFDNGKVAVYEFDSEQYRSPIRNHYIKLQGVRGEMKDNCFYWLDEANEPQKGMLVPEEKCFTRNSDNPNLQHVCECEEIRFRQDGKPDELVYEAPFGQRGMSKGETAVALLMKQAAEYDRKNGEQALRETLQDAYMAILMKSATETGEVISSEVQSWHKI